MIKVLCYGDSNTWGYRGSDAKRFGRDVRWTGILRQHLCDEYEVVEEGLNGRTTVWDDPIEGSRNGETYLVPCLETHAPMDLVVIMLGTNDLKMRFSLSAYDIAAGMEKLINIIEKSESGIDGSAPKILLLCPAPIGKLTDFADMFTGGLEKSRKLAGYYKDIAQRHGCGFIDVSSVAQTCDDDGIHFDEKAHTAIGNAVAQKVREMFI